MADLQTDSTRIPRGSRTDPTGADARASGRVGSGAPSALTALTPDKSSTLKTSRATNPRLLDYLRAPESVQEAFDRRIRAELDRRDVGLDQDLAADPLARRVQHNRDQLAAALGLDQPPATVGVRWDRRWQRRAANARNRQGRPEQRRYDREALLAIDLREAWEDITGEPVHRGRASCPNPDHEDRNPACGVRDSDWRCFACGAHGTIIDLGALVWGIEPTGAGYFQIAERIAAATGGA